MPRVTGCPDVGVYQRLASDELSEAEEQALVQHLESCEACGRALASLPDTDTLVDLLRQARPRADDASRETITRLVERLSKQGPMNLPADPLVLFVCPGCGRKLKIEASAAGKKVQCPGCRQVVQVPPAAVEVSTPAPAGQAGTPAPEETQTWRAGAGPSRPEDKSQELYDFLGPPQAPDELGRLGHYRVLKVLGRGGMGVVFLADEPALQRRVALKAMLPELAASKAARRRFLREAQAAAAVEHDHIIAIHFVGEDRGVPFLVMPLLQGESLDKRLRRERRLPLAEVLRIGREMAEGLAAAHERGLIHRDIKPANVWLETRPSPLTPNPSPPRGEGSPLSPLSPRGRGVGGEGGRVKILDFGLARAAGGGPNLTQLGAIVGTPAFMAPEQRRSEAVDGRCDLFSLGCVLYRACTGRVPFQGSDTVSTLMAVATETPPAPRSLNAEVPPALQALILRLLAKEPGDRPADAREVIETLADLERDLAAAPPVAKPTRSSRRLLIGAALLLMGLLAAAVGLSLRTGIGTLEVTVSEPGVQVLVDGQEKVVLESKKTGRIELIPGEHRLIVKRGDEELYAEAFTLKSGGKVVIDARWTPKEAAGAKDEAWCQAVAALKPEDQVAAVAARLKERNPGFDGKVTPKIDGDAVVSLEVLTDEVTDISPVRALKGLQAFSGSGSGSGKGKLADLSPLKGLPLTGLDFHQTRVSDLAPLAGMKLTFLGCAGTRVSDLAPLKNMPLTILYCDTTAVSDLSPLAGLPLTRLTCFATQVSDLKPLAGMKLTYLDCAGTRVSDLSPLKGMPLTELWCQDTAVTDLKPLAGMPLEDLHCDFKPERDAALLRSLKTLEKINGKPAADFWKEVNPRSATDRKPSPIPDVWFKEVAAMPAAKQVEAVAAKLKEHNPGFDGKVGPTIARGRVTGLKLSADEVTDLSPLRALEGLQAFDCRAASGKGKLADLSPLAGLPLTDLWLEDTPVSDLSPLKDMPLRSLNCGSTRAIDLAPLAGMKLTYLGCGGSPISDLSPLAGMKLTRLNCWGTPVSDLSPLAGMPLTFLCCLRTKVSDLSPLKGMPLRTLFCGETTVSDLSPLKGMKLTDLRCDQTQVRDLSPLRGMPLAWLDCWGTSVIDLSPLKGMPLKVLRCDFDPERHSAVLRSLETLETINEKPAAKFWKEVDARKANEKP